MAFAEQMTDEGFHVLAPGCPRGRACAAGAPISSQRNGGKEGAGGSFLRWLRVDFHRRCPRHLRPPAPPSTGAHGGGGLYGQGIDQPRIAARPIGTYVTGAAAPRVARIGVALQALEMVALYQVRPPGRRRCHASEIPGQSPQPSVGVHLCVRPPRAEGALQRKPPRPVSCL